MTGDRRQFDRRANDERMQAIERQLAENTALTVAVHTNTKDMVEVWQSVRSGMKVLGWLGVAARWVAIIAGCVTAVLGAFYAWTHMGAPRP